MSDRLKGKVAVVTGASSGIGAKTAEILAKEGASVVLAARRKDKLEANAEAIRAIGGEAFVVTADVKKKDDCVRIIEETIAKYGKIDILVNNAGIADRHLPITRCDDDWWDEVILIDQTSVFYITKAALKYMEPAKSGSIVNISSIGGVFGSAGISYSAAKSALLGMTKNIAIQFAGKGIRCNAVCPGPTPTELNTPDKIATFDSEFGPQCHKHMNMELPETTVEDQANAVLFFASDEAKGVTGQILIVDNGITL
jgi:NAD(P)-dependent dehydrogenase (short-subunit alcohol dehydrogenase family)